MGIISQDYLSDFYFTRKVPPQGRAGKRTLIYAAFMTKYYRSLQQLNGRICLCVWLWPWKNRTKLGRSFVYDAFIGKVGRCEYTVALTCINRLSILCWFYIKKIPLSIACVVTLTAEGPDNSTVVYRGKFVKTSSLDLITKIFKRKIKLNRIYLSQEWLKCNFSVIDAFDKR